MKRVLTARQNDTRLLHHFEDHKKWQNSIFFVAKFLSINEKLFDGIKNNMFCESLSDNDNETVKDNEFSCELSEKQNGGSLNI